MAPRSIKTAFIILSTIAVSGFAKPTPQHFDRRSIEVADGIKCGEPESGSSLETLSTNTDIAEQLASVLLRPLLCDESDVLFSNSAL